MQIAELLASIYESVLFVVFLDLFCGNRHSGWKRGTGTAVTCAALSLHIVWMDFFTGEPEIVSLFFDALILVIYWKICLQPSFLRFLTGFCFYYFGICISVILPIFGIELLTEEGILAWRGEKEGIRVLFLLLNKGLLSGYATFLLYLRKRFFFPKRNISCLVYVLMQFLIFLLCFGIAKEIFGGEWSRNREASFLMILVIVLLLLAVEFYLAVQSFQKEKALLEARKREELYQTEQRLTGQLYEMLRELGSVKHEIVNRLLAVSYLLEEGRIEEGIQQIQTGIKEWGGTEGYERQDELWATILTQKLARYPEYKNNVQIQVEPGDYSAIAPVEFCSLLGNLLENALEAQQKAEEHWIRLEMQERFGCLYIKIGNSCSKKDTIEQQKESREKLDLTTTKKEYWEHGYGLEHVKEIVERYDGMIEIEQDKGEFWVKLLLNLPNLT